MNMLNKVMITGALLLAGGLPAEAAQWDGSSAAYHAHLVAVEPGFELHVHDKAKHLPVDLTKGKVTATMLKDGKRIALPLAHKQTGIMTGKAGLAGQWTILVAFSLAGQKPQQIRFSSTSTDGHDHEH
jgi:hypothetical protein